MEILVLGAGGFIGGHMVTRLKEEGHSVKAVDIKEHEYSVSAADEFILGDLRDRRFVSEIINQPFDEIYQFAADMGGAGYIFTGENDANVMHNSASINLNVLDACTKYKPGRIFYASSACIYPAENQLDPDNPNCAEDSAYPANPDSEYGWEKLFSERLYMSYARNYGLTCRIGRYHNIFGALGTWTGGKEKAPAALCRKIAEANDGTSIEIWGDGKQTRSFLHIGDCLDATTRLIRSDYTQPLNIGSEEMVQINGLAEIIISISKKTLSLKHITGPQGVRGRTSDNTLIRETLDWEPKSTLRFGLEQTYPWINAQVHTNLEK